MATPSRPQRIDATGRRVYTSRGPGEPPSPSRIDPATFDQAVLSRVMAKAGTLFDDVPGSALEIQLASNSVHPERRLSEPLKNALRSAGLMNLSQEAPTDLTLTGLHLGAAAWLTE